MTDYSSVQSRQNGLIPADNVRHKDGERYPVFSTLSAGVGLIAAGALSLIASYMSSSPILTLGGLGLVFWGVIMLYISPSKHVPEKLFGSLSLSMIKSIDRLVVSMAYRGRTVFLHPKHLKGLAQGYVFIPYDNLAMVNIPTDEQLAEEKTIYNSPRGLLMPAPSQAIVKLIEEELDSNLAIVDLAYLRENLPKLLINNLKIIDGLSIEERPDSIRVSIVGSSAAELCRTVSKETLIGDHFGCPICSAFGLMISKVTGKPVCIQESKVDESIHTIITSYKIVERTT